MTEFNPVAPYLLVLKITPPEKTATGVFLPEGNSMQMLPQGKVLAVNVYTDLEQFDVDQVVVYKKWTPFVFGGTEYHLVNEEDVYGNITDED